MLEPSLVLLGDEESIAAAALIDVALATLDAAVLETSYLHCFGHCISKECPPYEGEYQLAHIFQKSQCLADLMGFYRAFGLDLAGNFHDRADHLCAELEFIQWLCLKEAHVLAKANNTTDEHVTLCRNTQSKFLDEHLGRWVLIFASKLAVKAGAHFHGFVGALLATFMINEMRVFGLDPVVEVPLTSAVSAPEEDLTACDNCPASGVVNSYGGKST